jgi:NAD(P)-dependent dehydrogenase (short-subunit alcohol dehydrogenase family)
MKFDQKIALVTGSSKGLGKVIAKELAKRGCHVILCSRQSEALSDTANEIMRSGGKCDTIAADLTKAEEVEMVQKETASRFGRLDILVNNLGGIRKFMPFDQISDQEWLDIFELNFFATMRVTRAFLPMMQKQKWGRVINISSEVGVQPEPLAQHYCAAKAATNNLTKSLSMAYGKQGILINAVSPAFIMTPEIEQLLVKMAEKSKTSFDDTVANLMSHQHRSKHSIARPAKPEEVASLVVFLASDLASYINGSNFRVDGGSIATL